ncbi:MAG: NADH-quinone oxidoreductase subunit NuoF [Bacteroidota bacterium]|nr:NADH-quinone oxidoreductase subunit NuoF [Bacteroidota bacterium]
MSESTIKILLPEILNLHRLEIYQQHNGYAALRKIFEMKPDEVIDEVKKSGLRGRGGAAFPTGLKWSFMPKSNEKPKYLCANGDEGEPGTFKDRQIFEFNPHLFIEGCLIASYAMGINATYVYIRGEYKKWIDILQQAIDEAYDKNYIGKNILGKNYSTDIYIHRGAGAYICGEESSLMNSIEGERGYPRVKPPFPAQSGLWGNPTNVNNIETLSCIPSIILNGGEWFSKIGDSRHPGTILFGISGHVNKPGVYELPTSVLLTDLIYKFSGGIKDGKKLKAVIPGGSSVPWLLSDELDGVRMDLESLKAAGSAIGTGGVIVLDEDTDVLKVLKRLVHFYHHESCGQCTPCREGCGWMEKILERFLNGNGTMSDVDLLLDVANNIEGNTVCALGDAAAWPVQSVIKKFRNEFEKRARKEPIQRQPVKAPHVVEV